MSGTITIRDMSEAEYRASIERSPLTVYERRTQHVLAFNDQMRRETPNDAKTLIEF